MFMISNRVKKKHATSQPKSHCAVRRSTNLSNSGQRRLATHMKPKNA